jgi:beta-glucosidase
LETIFKANPNVVLVLNNGRPLAIPWAENIPAIVEGWHLGTQSGNAIAQVLYGDYNPSGKLPMTSKECGQVPIYYKKIQDGRL